MQHMDFEETNYFGPYGLKRQHRWIENKIWMECMILMQNSRFYGLTIEHRWTQDGIWKEYGDFEETILDLMDLEDNLGGIWMECEILERQFWILWT